METKLNIRYTNIQRHNTTIYDPTFQGTWYEDDDVPMLINFEDTLGSIRPEEEKI